MPFSLFHARVVSRGHQSSGERDFIAYRMRLSSSVPLAPRCLPHPPPHRLLPVSPDGRDCPGSSAGIFGCNAGMETHAARTSDSYVDVNGFKVFGNGAVVAPGTSSTPHSRRGGSLPLSLCVMLAGTPLSAGEVLPAPTARSSSVRATAAARSPHGVGGEQGCLWTTSQREPARCRRCAGDGKACGEDWPCV